jgi:hypothetical protein
MSADGTIFEIGESMPAIRKARYFIPDWYKALPAFDRGFDDVEEDEAEKPSSTVKMCRPFGDALRLGIAIRSPCDIHLDKQDGEYVPVKSDAEEFLTLYDVTQPQVGGNSTFKIPEAKVDMPVWWETPPGVLSFFSTPMNRNNPDFTSFSLAVEAGNTPHHLVAPLVFESSKVRIDKGDPLLEAFFLMKDNLLTTYTTGSFNEYPDHYSEFLDVRNVLNSKKDAYRQHFWKRKDETSITETSVNDYSLRDDATTTTPTYATSMEYIPDDPTADAVFLCGAASVGVIPDPVPSNELIPSHYHELASLIPDNDGDAELMAQWIVNAMHLGVTVPNRADATITQDRGDKEINVDTAYDDPLFRTMLPNAMRGNPLDHFMIINAMAEWSYVTPNNYSVLYSQPQNHFQSKLRSFSGIVEEDGYRDTANAPSLTRTADQSFFLEKGSPNVELIPIHRDNFGPDVEVRVVSD